MLAGWRGYLSARNFACDEERLLANDRSQVNVHTGLGSDVGHEGPAVSLGLGLRPSLLDGVGQSRGGKGE